MNFGMDLCLSIHVKTIDMSSSPELSVKRGRTTQLGLFFPWARKPVGVHGSNFVQHWLKSQRPSFRN
jgi:hypothetical protein